MKHLLLSVLFITAATLAGLPAQAQMRQNDNLTIFFTGDTAGEVTSCGCKTDDYGGLSRRAGFLETLRAGGWEFPLVDAGGLAPWGPMNVQKRLRVETVARALGLMGYDAVTLGPQDLQHGPEFAAEIADWFGGPLLATNFTLPEGTFERTKILAVRSQSVGIIAVMDPMLVTELAPWVDAQPFESIQADVTALAEQVDIVIAIAQLQNADAAQRLLEALPEVNVLIAGNEGSFPGELTLTYTGGIMGVGHQGKYLGRMELAVDPDGVVHEVYGDYLPVIKDWGFRPEVDEVVTDYTRKVRDLMFAEPEGDSP